MNTIIPPHHTKTHQTVHDKFIISYMEMLDEWLILISFSPDYTSWISTRIQMNETLRS